MVERRASQWVDCGFEPRRGQTRDLLIELVSTAPRLRRWFALPTYLHRPKRPMWLVATFYLLIKLSISRLVILSKVKALWIKVEACRGNG